MIDANSRNSELGTQGSGLAEKNGTQSAAEAKNEKMKKTSQSNLTSLLESSI